MSYKNHRKTVSRKHGRYVAQEYGYRSTVACRLCIWPTALWYAHKLINAIFDFSRLLYYVSKPTSYVLFPRSNSGWGIINWAAVSVCSSVCHLRRDNSRTERPKAQNWQIVARHASILWTYSEVKRSKVKVTRPINADTVSCPMPNIFRKGRPTNFKLCSQTEHEDPHQRQATWPPRSKVKVAR